jgi:hypothetical protein
LRAADAVVVSAAKSGRTWLAVLISHVYHQRFGIDEQQVIRSDNFRRLNPAAPSIYFTHDNRKDRERTPRFDALQFRGIKTILLVRDPRDTAVSAYFNRFRHPDKPRLGPYRRSMADFVIQSRMPKLIEFMQRWHRHLAQIDRHIVVRYEDLRSRPQAELARIMSFIDQRAPTAAEIANAVSFAAFENLHRKEAGRFFGTSRLMSDDPANPDAFKVRRGKVGGYRDYFTAEELGQIEALVRDADLGAFGYWPNPVVAGGEAELGKAPSQLVPAAQGAEGMPMAGERPPAAI